MRYNPRQAHRPGMWTPWRDGGTVDPFELLDERAARVIRELEAQDQEERARNLPPERRSRSLHPDSARFLHMLVLAGKYRRILEIGGSVGYSTIWLADAAHRNGGTVISCEIEPRRVEQNRNNVRRAGLHTVVSYLVGDARQTVAEHAGPFDFVLLDADKADYITYFELLIPKMLPNGLIVADNVISHAEALRAYVERVKRHPLYESVTVPIGRGLEISRRIR